MSSPSGSRRYGIVSALWLSFGSPGFFRDVASHWRGAAYGLLLILALLVTLRIAFTIDDGLDRFNRALAPAYIRQLPTITVQAGQASTPNAMRYLITEPRSGRTVILIYTRAGSSELQQTPARLYISRDQLTYRKSANETRSYELDIFGDLMITQAYASAMVDFLADWLGWILAPFIFVGVYLLRLLLALVLGLLGMIFTWALRVPLPYDSLVSLAIVTASPVIVVETLLGLLHTGFRLHWILGVLINLALLGLAVHANRRPARDSGFIAD